MAPAHRYWRAADVDDEVGIGAHERQAAGPRHFEQRAIVVGGLVEIVVEAGAQDGVRLFDADPRCLEPREGGGIALAGADAEEAPVALLGDVAQRDLAGGDDVIPGLARHAAGIEHDGDTLAGDRRVGDEHHRSPAGAKAQQRIARRRKGEMSIVQHAPDIAEHNLVLRQQFACVSEDRGRRDWRAAWRKVLRLNRRGSHYVLTAALPSDGRVAGGGKF